MSILLPVRWADDCNCEDFSDNFDSGLGSWVELPVAGRPPVTWDIFSSALRAVGTDSTAGSNYLNVPEVNMTNGTITSEARHAGAIGDHAEATLMARVQDNVTNLQGMNLRSSHNAGGAYPEGLRLQYTKTDGSIGNKYDPFDFDTIFGTIHILELIIDDETVTGNLYKKATPTVVEATVRATDARVQCGSIGVIYIGEATTILWDTYDFTCG